MKEIYVNGDRIQIKALAIHSKPIADSMLQLMGSPLNLNAENALETLLQLGSEILKLSATSIEIERMTAITQSLMKNLEDSSKETISIMDAAVKKLVDPKDGVMIRTANETVDRTRESINQLFIGEKAVIPQEVVKKVDERLEHFSREMHRVISQASVNIGSVFSLDSEHSPLRALKSDIFQTTHEMNRSLGEKLEQLRLKMESLDARKAVIGNSTKKGLPFEEGVFEMCSQISTASGDEAIHTGKSIGTIKNCKKGDFTVSVNKSLTRGQNVRIVVEAKSMNLSREEWRRELDVAMLNRGAEVAIAVVQKVDQMPNKSRISLADSNQLFVAYDPEIDDPAVLMCMLSFARAVVITKKLHGSEINQRIFSEVSEQLQGAMSNLDFIEGAVKTARQSLDKIESARISIKTTVEFQVHRLTKVAESGETQVA